MASRFRTLLIEAIGHFKASGYSSEADLREWIARLSHALDQELIGDDATKTLVADFLTAIYDRDVNRARIVDRVPGVTRYTIDRIAPELRAELDRRIYASADLIKINKQRRKQQTLQRFAGWVSSVPAHGEKHASARELAREMTKPVAQIKYEARRVAIDQGHKLSASVAAVVAKHEGAIAAIWHDRGEHDHGYDARPEHLKRSGQVFLIRDSWAIQEGLIKRKSRPYTDEIEDVAQLPFCSCFYQFLTTPHDVPMECLTAKGRAWVSGARTDAQPTPAQTQAGNYRKGHARIHGIDVSIETPKDALRTGTDAHGHAWAVPMPADYGYIRRTVGADGEQIDCYLGPDHDSPHVWIVAQRDAGSGAYDEDKVLLGFAREQDAMQAYLLGFSDGRARDRLGTVTYLPAAEFARRIRAGDSLTADTLQLR